MKHILLKQQNIFLLKKKLTISKMMTLTLKFWSLYVLPGVFLERSMDRTVRLVPSSGS